MCKNWKYASPLVQSSDTFIHVHLMQPYIRVDQCISIFFYPIINQTLKHFAKKYGQSRISPKVSGQILTKYSTQELCTLHIYYYVTLLHFMDSWLVCHLSFDWWLVGLSALRKTFWVCIWTITVTLPRYHEDNANLLTSFAWTLKM